MTIRNIFRRSALVALALSALLSCSSDKSPTDPGNDGKDDAPPSTSLSLSNDSLAFTALGDSVQLEATVRDQNDAVVEEAEITWSSTDTAVVGVSEAGWVIARSNGSALVIATAGSVADTAEVEVAQVAVAFVVDRDSVVLGEGDSVQLEAAVTDRNGHPVGETAVDWSIADTTVATIDQTGLLTAVLWGNETAVTVSTGDFSKTIPVRVMDQIIYAGTSSFRISNEDGSLVRLLPSGPENKGPVWSPDGQRIYFLSTRDGNSEIYVINADGSGETNLTNHASSDSVPSVSPDGNKIAFETDRDGDSEIYVMNADGSNSVNLTMHASRDRSPAWSPDGSKIAFYSDRDGQEDIFVMNADGSNPVNITNGSIPRFYSTFEWSPDGSKILFNCHCSTYQIYLVNADGTDLRLLTAAEEHSRHQSWSPDGTKIAFTGSGDGNYDVFLMNADGSGETNLTNHPEFDDFLEWLPDGRRLWIFTGILGDNYWALLDIEDGTVVRSTGGIGGAWRPRP